MVLRDRRVVDDLDALGRERRAELDVDRGVLGDELEDALAGRGELLRRRSGRRATAATVPASTCWRRPATRTWKNSSRLPAKIARNLTRSSSGLRSSRASSRTRALKSSQDSSRLRYGNGALGRGARGAGRARRAPRVVRDGGRVRRRPSACGRAPARRRGRDAATGPARIARAPSPAAGTTGRAPRGRSVLRDVPPLAGPRVEPDAHPAAGRRVDEDARRSAGSAARAAARRLAAARPDAARPDRSAASER